jgi:hypothetical protein
MLNDYSITIVTVILVGIFSFLVLGYLVSNDKLKGRFAKPLAKLYRVLSTLVILTVVGMMAVVTVMGIVEESGWIPRTREVPVYARVSGWIQGEIKTCETLATKQRGELAVLVCFDDTNLAEHHTLQVKFWGPITTERNKEWKCVRETASLTCRLQ